jgi:hypothetical protein
MNHGSCAICGEPFKSQEWQCRRQSWLDLGGNPDNLPPEACVHRECNGQEQWRLRTGKIKLSELFNQAPG